MRCCYGSGAGGNRQAGGPEERQGSQALLYGRCVALYKTRYAATMGSASDCGRGILTSL